MTTNAVKSTSLYNQTGGSDKVYHVHILPQGSGYEVVAFNGPRGGGLTRQQKTNAPVSIAEANDIFNKLVKSKIKGGYHEGEAIAAPNQDTASHRHFFDPQLLNAIDQSEVSDLINDDEFLAQEKFDGIRRIVQIKGSEIIGANKKGIPIEVPALLHQELLSLNINLLTLDSEAIGEHIYVFDLISYGTSFDGGKERLDSRLAQLEAVLATKDLKYIHIAHTAYTREEKLALYNKVINEGGEGIVFKRKSANYVAGRPNSRGDQLKYKFVETASCIVTGQNGHKNSVSIGLYDNGSLKEVGNVTIPPNKTIPLKLEVIEVRYLYAFREGSLFQPVYLFTRDDVDHYECEVTQLKYKQEVKQAA